MRLYVLLLTLIFTINVVICGTERSPRRGFYLLYFDSDDTDTIKIRLRACSNAGSS